MTDSASGETMTQVPPSTSVAPQVTSFAPIDPDLLDAVHRALEKLLPQYNAKAAQMIGAFPIGHPIRDCASRSPELLAETAKVTPMNSFELARRNLRTFMSGDESSLERLTETIRNAVSDKRPPVSDMRMARIMRDATRQRTMMDRRRPRTREGY